MSGRNRTRTGRRVNSPSDLLVGGEGTRRRQGAADTSGGSSRPLMAINHLVELAGRASGLTGKMPFFASMVLLGLTANIVAAALSWNLPAGTVEMNPLARPGTFTSLGFSVTLVLVGSLICRILPVKKEERVLFLAFFTALLTGDAVSDAVTVLTRNMIMALLVSYGLVAFVPTIVALKFIDGRKR